MFSQTGTLSWADVGLDTEAPDQDRRNLDRTWVKTLSREEVMLEDLALNIGINLSAGGLKSFTNGQHHWKVDLQERYCVGI